MYVDNIIIKCDDLQEIHDIKTHFDYVFNNKDLGKLGYFLGIRSRILAI